MSKTLKTLLYILCVSALLVGFGACKSQPEPKPEPKPEPADDTAAVARSGYESNNFADAQAKAQRAITQYRTLINRTKIDELKAKIDQNDLSAYDAANYKKAEDAAARIPGLYESDPSKAF